MICVVEYGENIGTLRNLFPTRQQAIVFAKRIIAARKKSTLKSRASRNKILPDP
jgi:hypothetical protein